MSILERVRPASWGELSTGGRVKRVVAVLTAVAAAGMAWAASTADSDWNITQADVAKRFG